MNIALIVFFFYLVTVALTGLQILNILRIPLLAIRISWLVALILHVIMLVPALFTIEGLDLAFFKAGSTVMFIISAVLFCSCLYKPLHLLAVWILPLTALSVLLSASGLSDGSRIVATDTLTIQLHIMSSLLAYSVMIITAVLAILFHFQNSLLHQGRLPVSFKILPPLDTTEAFLFHLIIFSLIMLTLSLVSGWLYHEDLFSQHLVHKTVLSFSAWVLLLILFIGRLLFGWREKKIVNLTISVSVLLILAYFGSKLVLEIILNRV